MSHRKQLRTLRFPFLTIQLKYRKVFSFDITELSQQVTQIPHSTAICANPIQGAVYVCGGVDPLMFTTYPRLTESNPSARLAWACNQKWGKTSKGKQYRVISIRLVVES